ncbi:MAG TPA: L,D-transpeptidase [Thermoleophilaceae bacterium]|nr:L,D-transpeptidase [Thermoleophilaceae bacterium]
MSRLTSTATAVGVALATMGVCSAAAAPAPAAAATAESTRLVVLLKGHVARSRPSLGGRRLEYVPARRPLTHVRTVLPVIGRRVRGGRSWVHVRLPGRPSGHTGWIRGGQTRPSSTPWRIRVRLSSRRVAVYHEGRVVRRFRAIVGTPSTPTPRGRFFVEEALALSPSAHGGPFALATSARSSVYQEFEGGPGQIAMHGTNGLSGSLGTAASHGCIRLSPRAITWLARRVAGGTPLRVTR